MPPPKSSSYQRGGGLGSDPGHAGLGTSWYSLEEIEEVDRETDPDLGVLAYPWPDPRHTTRIYSNNIKLAFGLEKCTQMITKRGKEVRTED